MFLSHIDVSFFLPLPSCPKSIKISPGECLKKTHTIDRRGDPYGSRLCWLTHSTLNRARNLSGSFVLPSPPPLLRTSGTRWANPPHWAKKEKTHRNKQGRLRHTLTVRPSPGAVLQGHRRPGARQRQGERVPPFLERISADPSLRAKLDACPSGQCFHVSR